jgi:hypothetical protein
MVARSPVCASPARDAQWCGSPLATAVTKRDVIDGRSAHSLEVLPGLTQPTRLFSWAVITQGPGGLPWYHHGALPK